mmetsp:Transcript_9443/g.14179  ORF Transcript_9443/g.14179 Transcript_9443/m.14179 type:complete len:325 (-) Transcript_9443:149-1123(-)
MQEEEEKKAEEGPFSDPQSVEEASPINNETIDATESNLREKFAEVGGFEALADDPDEHRQGFAIPSTSEEIADAGKRWGDGSWQMKLLKIINSDFIQRFLVVLLVLDVLVLFVELALDAFFPLSQLVVRDAISCCPPESGYVSSAAKEEGHRFLGGGGSTEICAYPLEETDYKAGYDYSKFPGIHVAHTALYSTTLVILSSFLLELLALVYLLGPKQFFKQVTYVVDLVIVAMSLSLEILLKHASKEVLSVIPGILIIFRVWRFVRIGHGLVASTYELQQHKLHLAVSYIEELEERVKKYEDEPTRTAKMDKLIRRLSSSNVEH